MCADVARDEIVNATLLAGLYGIETSYVNTFGKRVDASEAALEAVLRARSALLDGESIDEAIARRRRELRDEWLPPVVVVRAGSSRLPLPRRRKRVVSWRLFDEEQRLVGEGDDRIGPLNAGVPLAAGYYDLQATSDGDTRTALVISAPRRAYRASSSDRSWAAFAPLYALRDENDWGIGDLATARRLTDVLAAAGANSLATLPLLSAYLDELFDPSPYAPVSRLFWNEIFLDLGRPSAADAEVVAELRRRELVDYRGVMRLKRAALERRAEEFERSADHAQRAAFERFAASVELRRYARFRALTEMRGVSWREWSDVERGGAIDSIPVDPARLRYHMFVQWLAETQLEQLSAYARQRGCGLFLDFPLGSNSDGFDVWNEPHLYRDDVVIGAPPDLSYPQGQSWGFRPIDPDALRRDRYRHWLACIRQQLRFATRLRIDHVMSLHRLYWIPEGFPPGDGVYVRYPAEELFAILAVESHRFQCEIVGEDLGTVPDIIRKLMRRHSVRGLYVLQRQVVHHPDNAPSLPNARQVASVNNHDLPPFASFLASIDLEEKARLGVIPPERVEAEYAKRRRGIATLRNWLGDADDRELFRRAVMRIARTRAPLVIVSLEDLWGETVAQNVPTTSTNRPNWRHKMQKTVDEIALEDFSFVRRTAGRRRRER